MKKRALIALALALAIPSCGSKDGPSFTATINYGSKTYANTFGSATLSDVVVIAVGEGTPVYDVTGDGQADNIVFPEKCAQPPVLDKGCGFTAQEVQQGNGVTISGLPLGYSWHLELRGRNATGSNLFTGKSAAFLNEVGALVPPIALQ